MSQKTREAKKKQRQAYLTREKASQSSVNKFYIRSSKMTEPEIAKLANDACVYLGAGMENIPPVALISTDHTASDKFLRDAMSHPPQPDKKIAVIRPGNTGLLTVDSLETLALGKMRLETHVVAEAETRVTPSELYVYYKPNFAPLRIYDGLLGLLPKNPDLFAESDRDRMCAITMAMVILDCQSKMWSSHMTEGNATVGVISDPVSLREMFKLRDKPEGKKRRDALAHIVKGHWRSQANKSECRRYVESYLRGSTEFEWFGLDVTLNTNNIDL